MDASQCWREAGCASGWHFLGTHWDESSRSLRNPYKAFDIMLRVQAVNELTPPHTQCHWTPFWGTSLQTGACELALLGERLSNGPVTAAHTSGMHSSVNEKSLMLTELGQG